MSLEPAQEQRRPTLNSDAEVSHYIKSREKVYQTKAKSAGFNIGFGDKTCFEHRSDTVLIGIKQFRDMGIELGEEFDFAVLHETKHYEDFESEPDEYEKLIAKGTRDDGLGELYFRFYNTTEDIAVNTRVAYDSPLYRGDKTRFSDSVHTVYREKLFKERDWRKKPLSVQYAHYILNCGMEVESDIKLSPEVEEMVSKPIDVYGKKVSLKEFIDAYLRPAPPGEGAYGDTVQNRLKIVDKFILPRFEALIQKDKEQKREQDLRNLDGSPVPGSSGLDDFKKAIETFKNKANEKNQSASARAKAIHDKQLKGLASQAGLTPQETEEFMRIYTRAEDQMIRLAKLWLSLPQPHAVVQFKKEGYFPTGIAPDIKRLIKLFPELEHDPSKVEVMLRSLPQEKKEVSPKRFRLWLVLDISGSMKYSIPLVSELGVALTGSFAKTNAEAVIQGVDFMCSLNVITFGVSAHEVLVDQDPVSLQDMMNVYKTFSELEDDTNDHLALEKIKERCTAKDREDRESGELVDVIIEITDGDTKEPNQSRAHVHYLEEQGFVTRAIQIGAGELFKSIWNSDGKERGKQVDTPSELLQCVEEFLGAKVKELQEKAAAHIVEY